jgi:hypothetical protein
MSLLDAVDLTVLSTRQNEVQYALSAYVNGGCFSARDRLLSGALPTIPFRRNAPAVSSISGNSGITKALASKTRLRPTRGEISMSGACEYLQDTIADSLVGAYVHGSLGTGDESLTAISTPW